MACKQGIRRNIEASKRYYEQQKKYDPFRELWKSLVHRVDDSSHGYDGLSDDERLYFSVGVLDAEIYNGGMYQFFSNSSGSMFTEAVDGLLELKAHESLKLLLRAKDILFDEAVPPQDREERWHAMKQDPDDGSQPEWISKLKEVDEAYWRNPDKLNERLRAFAEERGLIAPFNEQSEDESKRPDKSIQK